MPKFGARKKTEQKYKNQLVQIAREVDKIVRRYYDPEHPEDTAMLEMALQQYANSLDRWARKAAKAMLMEVNFYDVQDFKSVSEKLGQNFARNYTSGKEAVFSIAQQLYSDQLQLIRSIPEQALERVKKYVYQAQVQGLRHTELISRIMDSGRVSYNRAKLIARTEVAKANATLSQARAESVGITRFIWRTAGDENVRSSHARLNGKIFEYKNPPYIAGEGYVLPSQIWNCRCIAEPLFDPATQGGEEYHESNTH